MRWSWCLAGTSDEIDMDHEPEGFARSGRGSVMVLKHDRAAASIWVRRRTVYAERPLVSLPARPDVSAKWGSSSWAPADSGDRVPATTDGYELVRTLTLNQSYDGVMLRYRAKIADWNRLQRRRKRQGQAAQTARAFLTFLGVVAPGKPAQASGAPRTSEPHRSTSPTLPTPGPDNLERPSFIVADRCWPRPQGLVNEIAREIHRSGRANSEDHAHGYSRR